MLSALLNEVSCESGRVFLGGKVAYCAQQPWITNATLRDNILWGEPYHEDRYKRAVWSCALEEDLKQMVAPPLSRPVPLPPSPVPPGVTA